MGRGCMMLDTRGTLLLRRLITATLRRNIIDRRPRQMYRLAPPRNRRRRKSLCRRKVRIPRRLHRTLREEQLQRGTERELFRGRMDIAIERGELGQEERGRGADIKGANEPIAVKCNIYPMP